MKAPCLAHLDNKDKNKAIFEKSKIWKSDGNITIAFGNYECNDCSKDTAWSLIGNDAKNNDYPSRAPGRRGQKWPECAPLIEGSNLAEIGKSGK